MSVYITALTSNQCAARRDTARSELIGPHSNCFLFIHKSDSNGLLKPKNTLIDGEREGGIVVFAGVSQAIERESSRTLTTATGNTQHE